jgi:hypothetical protein
MLDASCTSALITVARLTSSPRARPALAQPGFVAALCSLLTPAVPPIAQTAAMRALRRVMPSLLPASVSADTVAALLRLLGALVSPEGMGLAASRPSRSAVATPTDSMPDSSAAAAAAAAALAAPVFVPAASRGKPVSAASMPVVRKARIAPMSPAATQAAIEEGSLRFSVVVSRADGCQLQDMQRMLGKLPGDGDERERVQTLARTALELGEAVVFIGPRPDADGMSLVAVDRACSCVSVW